MRRWELAVALDQSRKQPLFLQLAKGIADDIQCGRLKPGDSLPGSRELAQRLGVHRNTVVAGYDELVAEGLIATRIGGGTFVAGDASPLPAQNVPNSELPTYLLPPPRHRMRPCATPPPGALMMSIGGGDARLFPARELARAFRRALERRVPARGPADPAGHVRLRTELATMLSHSRGVPASAENVMVTRSIEQGIDLVARTLIEPGDVVAVEAFGYPPAWSVFRLAGARLVPIPLDHEGMNVDALETLLERQRIRAVFLTPHHQFPTGAVMSASRRARLAELALRHGFAIIEDDYDHEFHYAGKPVLPIAGGPGRANVIYIGSLANLLAPGIGTGFVLAPPPVFDRLLSLRAASDARGDAAMECAIAELFEDGELARHVRRVRRIYEKRRDVLADALQRELSSAVKFRVPDGGMGMWIDIDPAIDVTVWTHIGESEGVVFSGARQYDVLDREQPFARLGFCNLDEAEILDGVKRMARALGRIRASNAPNFSRVRANSFVRHAGEGRNPTP